MNITISNFSDLVEIINTQPQLRQQLIKVLFPNIDLAQSMSELHQALKELAQAQAQTEQALKRAAEDRLRIETKFDAKLDEAAEDRRRIETKFDAKLDEAAEDRRRIETEAAEDRRRIETKFDAKLDEAAEDRRRIETKFDAKLDEAAEDRRRIETKFDAKLDEAAEDRRRIETKVDGMHQDVAKLKGDSYESSINKKSISIFGGLIRRGKDIRERICRQLYEALDAGKISIDELTQVIATDLLWRGRTHPPKLLDIVLVIEASWTVETNDLKRVITRANILRTIEINALPVVAGNIWNDELVKLALEHGVVVVEDKLVHRDTWDSALRVISHQLSRLGRASRRTPTIFTD